MLAYDALAVALTNRLLNDSRNFKTAKPQSLPLANNSEPTLLKNMFQQTIKPSYLRMTSNMPEDISQVVID